MHTVQEEYINQAVIAKTTRIQRHLGAVHDGLPCKADSSSPHDFSLDDRMLELLEAQIVLERVRIACVTGQCVDAVNALQSTVHSAIRILIATSSVLHEHPEKEQEFMETTRALLDEVRGIREILAGESQKQNP